MSDHVIFGGRCSGKTTRMLDEAKRLAGEGRHVVFISPTTRRSLNAKATFTRLHGRPPHGITFTSVDAILVRRSFSVLDSLRGIASDRCAVFVDDAGESGLEEISALASSFYLWRSDIRGYEVYYSGVPNSDLTHWFNAFILTSAWYRRAEFLAPSSALQAMIQTLNPKLIRTEILGEVTQMAQFTSGDQVKLVVSEEKTLEFLTRHGDISFNKLGELNGRVGNVEDYGSPYLVEFENDWETDDEHYYISDDFLVKHVELPELRFGTPVQFEFDGDTFQGVVTSGPDSDADYHVRYIDNDGDETYIYRQRDELTVKSNAALLHAVADSVHSLFERFGLERTIVGTQNKLREEYGEFAEAVAAAGSRYVGSDPNHRARRLAVADEFGDLLITAVNAAEAVGVGVGDLVEGVERANDKNDHKNWETHKLVSGAIVRR